MLLSIYFFYISISVIYLYFSLQLRQVNDEIRFQLVPVIAENITLSTSVKFPPYNTSWHAVELNYTKGELNILLDYRNKQSKLFAMTFELGDKVIIGSGKSNAGK